MRILMWLVPVVAASALGTACATDSAQTDSAQSLVAITSQIDFTEEPFQGTFEVTEGADALGCSSGSFVDAPPDSPTDRGIHKEFTCESGTSTGTFTAEFFPPSGPWKIADATEDFSGLSGWGAFASIPDEADQNAGVETFIGEIQSGSGGE
jgi:hypothetical protein